MMFRSMLMVRPILGYLKVLNDRDPFVETETENDFRNLDSDLADNFQDQVDLERI